MISASPVVLFVQSFYLFPCAYPAGDDFEQRMRLGNFYGDKFTMTFRVA